ncbi:MAG: fluoride efflux transporter CrcB [bacterium]|nr:fluoride efflux transporter CrcB [bacterium]
MSLSLSRFALAALGGLAGCVARYWLIDVVQTLANHGFPWGTLVVNILGSFLIGLVMTLSLERGLVGADLRILLTTGFCSGFTTMSTFSYETLALLREGERWLAMGNLGVTFAACLGAVWLGSIAARLL